MTVKRSILERFCITFFYKSVCDILLYDEIIVWHISII